MTILTDLPTELLIHILEQTTNHASCDNRRKEIAPNACWELWHLQRQLLVLQRTCRMFRAVIPLVPSIRCLYKPGAWDQVLPAHQHVFRTHYAGGGGAWRQDSSLASRYPNGRWRAISAFGGRTRELDVVLAHRDSPPELSYGLPGQQVPRFPASLGDPNMRCGYGMPRRDIMHVSIAKIGRIKESRDLKLESLTMGQFVDIVSEASRGSREPQCAGVSLRDGYVALELLALRQRTGPIFVALEPTKRWLSVADCTKLVLSVHVTPSSKVLSDGGGKGADPSGPHLIEWHTDLVRDARGTRSSSTTPLAAITSECTQAG